MTILYSAVTFITVGLLPGQTLASSLTPIADAGRAGGGIILYTAITAASLLAFITTANGGILTASQYPVALSRDGMLPALFSKPGKRNGTQFTAIIATGILICCAVLLELDMLIKAASTVILLTNIFAHLSVIVMRESRIVSYKPTYSAPLYPWLQIIGIIVFILLIIDMGLQPVLISTAFTAIGVILYFIRRRHSDTVSPAVIHILQRITNKELAIEGLQKELRGLVEDRDNIVRDEFDDAIEKSCFMEITGSIDLSELWDSISETLTECLAPELSPKKVKELLRQREEQSSTCISEFVAIPHLITEGQGIFRMGCIRAPEGVRFSSERKAVKAVFVLIGTKDMRNLHLRALTAIAQIVQQPNFEDHWLKAGSHNDIIDFFILSKRRR